MAAKPSVGIPAALRTAIVKHRLVAQTDGIFMGERYTEQSGTAETMSDISRRDHRED